MTRTLRRRIFWQEQPSSVAQEQPARIARLLLLFLFPVPCFLFPVVSSAGVAPEYELKAAVVSKFPAFTEWPPEALDGRATIDFCVARPNPFGPALARFVAGESAYGRALRVREVDGPAAIDGCRVLFVPAHAGAAGQALLDAARAHPILTVGESPAFLDEGGHISLRLVDGRVRFDIAADTAGRVGIRFSSQLLRLALDVRGGRP